MKKSAVLFIVFAVLAAVAGAGCVSDSGSQPVVLTPVSSTGTAQSGDTVSVDYTLTTDSGYTETSVGKEPLQFTIDAGTMIAGFNNGVKGMKVGETKTIVVPPSEGYGERTTDIVKSDLALKDVEQYLGREAKTGDIFDIMIQAGSSVMPMSAQILTIDRANDAITYSVNQRHAGETLTFEITLLSIDKKA
ncbi:MAG TPA: FKBP-type peptidyl-prolyl cis-trans isomerase [Methanocorpusculum sp.]|nr:FKBP-type peptidyl-prolyl cis-trans isomerase [Methanocorpusculum sp.]